MRKIYIVLTVCLLVLSCKNDSKTTESNASNNYETIAGDFLYLESDNAAVLKTPKEIYGVVIDDQMKKLHEQCKAYKKLDHDMVPVIIKGIKKKNTEANAWAQIIEVKEILTVSEPKDDQNATIIIKENKE